VKGGALTALKIKGARVFMGETVCVPKIDMLLNMMRAQSCSSAGKLYSAAAAVQEKLGSGK